MISGLWLAATGRQMRHRWFRETAFTAGHLGRACLATGLTCVWRSGFAQKPLRVFRKETP